MNEDTFFLKYTCPKCGGKQYKVGEIRTYGNFWEAFFKFHYKRFTRVTCTKCYFTELFEVSKEKIEEVYNAK
jgi:uncharacterized protein